MAVNKIAVVGSGLIGRAWAMVFAGAGFEVALFDAKPEAARAARAHARKTLKALAGHGLVADPDASFRRIRVARDLADALAGVELVQENGPETIEAKQSLFAEMDRLSPPRAILASSTSFIVASRFSESLAGRARCLVAHPVNPPHLVPIVELAPAPWTDPKVVARAKAIYEKAGQVPIVLRKESPGFVLNRLQAVLLAEAFRIVDEEICSPTDLDKTIKDGLGLRWSFMGPFETIELNAPGGIPDYAARYSASLADMVARSEGRPAFTPQVVAKIMAEWPLPQEAQRVARLSTWRDGRLAALKAHKRAAKAKPKS